MANSTSSALKPALCIVSINTEGFSQGKSETLSELCRMTNFEFMCVQETHRDETQCLQYIPEFTLIVGTCHPKHGNGVFFAAGVNIKSTKMDNEFHAVKDCRGTLSH